MTSKICNNLPNIGHSLVLSADGTTQEQSRVKVEIGSVSKFEYFGDFKQDQSGQIDQLIKTQFTPTFDALTGSCDNFLLEYHLRIQFESLEGPDVITPSFKITKATADLVFGKYVPASLDESTSIGFKTSLTFYQNDDFQLTSGTPGYIKGLPLRIGTLNQQIDPETGLETTNKKSISE